MAVIENDMVAQRLLCVHPTRRVVRRPVCGGDYDSAAGASTGSPKQKWLSFFVGSPA